ncbi:hypothetical protein C8R46DRAFT_1353174 [Mycena filopes]|nr:hypothetical protein C8R46DRAFT_1353174 [Mycena filopes]
MIPSLDCSATGLSDYQQALRVDAPPRPHHLPAALNARHAANAAPFKSRLAELVLVRFKRSTASMSLLRTPPAVFRLSQMLRPRPSSLRNVERRSELRHLGARAPNGCHPRVWRTPYPVQCDGDSDVVAALVCALALVRISAVLTPLAGLPHPLGILHVVDATDPHRLSATPPHTPRRASAHDADSRSALSQRHLFYPYVQILLSVPAHA